MRTRWYRDPLVAFLVLGALLFVIVGDLDEDAQSTIDVRSQDVARLAQQWAMQMQREHRQECSHSFALHKANALACYQRKDM